MNRADRDAALFWDMLQACREIAGFVADKDRGQFISDRMLCLAVERCLEILGEAAGHVSSPCQDKNPEIPWRRMISMRNILAHDYGEIDYGIIFDTATVEVPALAIALAALPVVGRTRDK
jgi:uncharacterized protein with HEPN domain